MKTLKFNLIMIFAALLVAATGSDTFAQRGMRAGNGNGNGYGPGVNCRIPDLTDAQQKKLDQLRTAHWKEMSDYRNQLNEKHARLQTLQSADKADMNAINTLIDEIGKIKTQMAKATAAHRQEVRGELTEQQRVFFDQRRGRGFGPGYGHGKGFRGGKGHRGGGFGFRGNCPWR